MRPPVAGHFGEKNKVRNGLGRVAMKKQEVISIKFSRLPKVDETPGLVTLAIASDGPAPPRRLGALTDVALRGRLAHYDLHGANEVAAIRAALRTDNGQITVRESWSGLNS